MRGTNRIRGFELIQRGRYSRGLGENEIFFKVYLVFFNLQVIFPGEQSKRGNLSGCFSFCDVLKYI